MPALPGQPIDGNEAPDDTFAPIEGGSYNAHIIGSNGKQKDTGLFVIGLQFKVLDGPKANRTFWLNFNYIHPNSAQAQEIAQKQIKQIAKACGVGVFSDTESLHERPMNITVKVQEYQGRENNQFSSVRPIGASGARPAASGGQGGGRSQSGAQTQQRAPAGAGGGSRPWGNSGTR